VVKKGADGGFLTHGVSIASLACDVLSDPDANEREAKPLGSSQVGLLLVAALSMRATVGRKVNRRRRIDGAGF